MPNPLLLGEKYPLLLADTGVHDSAGGTGGISPPNCPLVCWEDCTHILRPCLNLWPPLHWPCCTCLNVIRTAGMDCLTVSPSLSLSPGSLCRSQGCLQNALHTGSRHSSCLQDKCSLSVQHPRPWPCSNLFPLLPLPPETLHHSALPWPWLGDP